MFQMVSHKQKQQSFLAPGKGQPSWHYFGHHVLPLMLMPHSTGCWPTKNHPLSMPTWLHSAQPWMVPLLAPGWSSYFPFLFSLELALVQHGVDWANLCFVPAVEEIWRWSMENQNSSNVLHLETDYAIKMHYVHGCSIWSSIVHILESIATWLWNMQISVIEFDHVDYPY